MELSRRYDVVPSSDSTFKVKHGSKTFRVNLNTQSCACLEWDMDMIPCSHAVAAIWYEFKFNYVNFFDRSDNSRITFKCRYH
ncbi:SWIM zinc finger family protein, partial [Escherichia coli]|uniref:SWIM zinc finger family protein n=1 Tax=Escherichia coli TaxID=562 RepID=UPI003C6CF40D